MYKCTIVIDSDRSPGEMINSIKDLSLLVNKPGVMISHVHKVVTGAVELVLNNAITVLLCFSINIQ